MPTHGVKHRNEDIAAVALERLGVAKVNAACKAASTSGLPLSSVATSLTLVDPRGEPLSRGNLTFSDRLARWWEWFRHHRHRCRRMLTAHAARTAGGSSA